jgi:hypothetical protein
MKRPDHKPDPYRRAHVVRADPYFWIEKDGIVIYRSATSFEDAFRVIDELLS